MIHIGHSRSFDCWPVAYIWPTKEPPNTATMPVNNAPHKRLNTITGLREPGGSMLTSTSTPTWMPVRTP